MEASAIIKQEDGVETAKICRWCQSTSDALKPLPNDKSGQYKLQKLSECTGVQVKFLPGVPLYLCTMCNSRLEKTYLRQCNKNIALVNGFTENQNTAKNGADICKEHLGHSAEQTVGTELLIKTEVTAPDAAHDLQLIDSCCGNQPYDFFEAEENPIAIKSEYEEVDKHHQLQTTNDVMGHKQDNLKSHRRKQKHQFLHHSATYTTQQTPYSGKKRTGDHNGIGRSERVVYKSRRVLWTRELMFKVIDAMKEEQLLWNTKHVYFKHRSKKIAALNRVAAQLQLPIEAVRQKMDVLKSTYHKNRRALENQSASKIKWFAFDRLSFLAPAGEVCEASDVTDVPTNTENMEATYMGSQTLTVSERSTAIPPTSHETPRPNNNSSDGEVLERLLKVIEEGLKTANNPTWSDILGSYVSLEVQHAGERPDTEMRRLQRELIRLMEKFRKGELSDTEPSPSAISSPPF